MIVVTNTNDAGAGSLRQAIADAAVGEEITFSVTGSIFLTTGELLISQDVIITGPGSGSLFIDGGGLSRVFNTDVGTISISGMIIINGTSTAGGGIHNEATLTLDDVVVSLCTSPDAGGGIWNSSTITATDLYVSSCGASTTGGGIQNTGTITVTTGEINNNASTNEGGGIKNDSGTITLTGVNVYDNESTAGPGGAAWNDGTLTFIECGIYENIAFSGDGMAVFTSGGGTTTFTRSAVVRHQQASSNAIYNNLSTVYVINSTISTNTEGILNNLGSVDFSFSTCTLNDVTGLRQFSGSILQLYNTILAGSPTDYDGDTLDAISIGHNILGVNTNPITPATGDQTVLTFAALLLGALQNNGGLTETHALQTGSPAIDAGDPVGAPSTDQRGAGFPRITGVEIDIGAYEGVADLPCLTFTGTLPGGWYIEDENCIVVPAGLYRGNTRAEATAAAQAALDAFVAAALDSGDLVCTEE